MNVNDALAPAVLTGLDLPAERLEEVAREFKAIRVEIEKLRQLDMGETHPAVVFRPIIRERDQSTSSIDIRERNP